MNVCTFFGVVISGVWRGISGGISGWGCSLRIQNVSGLWLDVEEGTTARID